jgi:hypothetical protein
VTKFADHRRNDPLHEGLGEEQERNREQKPGVQAEMPQERVRPLSLQDLARNEGPNDHWQPRHGHDRERTPRQSEAFLRNQPNGLSEPVEGAALNRRKREVGRSRFGLKLRNHVSLTALTRPDLMASTSAA